MFEFEAVPVRCVYETEDFKIYGCQVDTTKYPTIKHNKYGNVSIVGCLPQLEGHVTYKIRAEEKLNKFGYQYDVNYISRDLPSSTTSSQAFLEELIPVKQAETLLNVYPDIIKDIMDDNLDHIDLKKTKGIKEKTFNKIKAKVIENFGLMGLVESFGGMISLKVMKKLLDIYKTPVKVIHKIRTHPYKTLTSVSQVGFKIADKVIQHMWKTDNSLFDIKGEITTSLDRMDACIYYNLKQNELQGDTKMLKIDLISQCENLTPECMMKFFPAIEKGDYVEDDKYISNKYTYQSELFVANAINELLENNNSWKVNLNNYVKINNGFEMTNKQLAGIANVSAFNASIINGYAGSGKTETINRLTKVLKDLDKSFLLLAPTGRAANVLTEYSKLPASTIHRKLGWRKGEWLHNEHNPLEVDLVIVDETSMVDVFLMKALLKAINPKRTKLLLVGDSAQIPSVGAGNVFHDLIKSGKIPITTLNEIFRYSEGGLMAVATWIRQGKAYLQEQAIQTFGKNKDYSFVNCAKEDLLENIKTIYRQLLNHGAKPENIYVLTFKKAPPFGKNVLNEILQPIANPNYGSNNYVKSGEVFYFKNDLVMQIANNYFVKDDGIHMIANGETGRIIRLDESSVTVMFSNHTITYKKGELLENIQLAYAMTFHKSQGAGVPYTILVTPSSDTYFLNSNLLYVGVTRTKKTCYHLGNMNTVNRIVKKKANFERKTFLKELL